MIVSETAKKREWTGALRGPKNLLVITAVLALGLSARAEFAFQNIYTDHMVLQRGKPVPVRGVADPGAKVSVDFDGHVVTATAGTNGQWRADLPAMDVVSVGKELTAVCGTNCIVCADVLVGDVWLCAGQSNMAFTFGRGIHDGKTLMAESERWPNIRVVRIANTRAILPSDYHVELTPWTVATPKTLSGMTACGYLFVRELHVETGVPMGVIQNAWSGQAIEPFISREGYDMVPELKVGQIHIGRRIKDVSSKVGSADYDWVAREMVKWAKKYEEWRSVGKRYPFLPMLDYRTGGGNEALFHNAMFEPIVTFPIAGAIWYQGESNGSAGMDYYHKLRGLVGGWRAKWGYDFPFYLVQLAAYKGYSDNPEGGEGWCATREAMRLFAQDCPKCGMAVAIDIGNETDIHPKDKLDVAKRLARWALRDVYGKNIVPCGPLYRDFAKEKGALRVRFDHVGSGLATAEKDPTGSALPPVFTNRREVRGFAIAGADKKWFWAKAVIDGKDVVVSSPDVPDPVAVRYAYRMNPMGHADLYNREGLPAAPFRTDDWR